jgi:uncharacterized protein YcnI
VSKKQFFQRAGFLSAAIGITGLLSTGVASAHVTANVYGDQLTKGGDDGAIFFRVPNEDATAGTIKVEVDFKPEYAIGDALTKPVPGWTADVTTSKLPAPVKTASGTAITEAVTKVTWTAQPGTKIAGTNEFQEFEVSAGPLPSNVDELVLPTVQTYDNGKVVNWNEVAPAGAAEPENPAPTVKLVAATADGNATTTGDASAAAASSTSDNTARWLGGGGLAVGALGLGVAAGATLRTRKAAAAASKGTE